MDDPKDLWPLTLGICRDCKACRLKIKTTLDGGISGALYYCNSTMHETDGKDRCADYQPRHRRPKNKDPARDRNNPPGPPPTKR